MVGSAVIRELDKASDSSEIIPVSREQVDLTNQGDVVEYIASKQPDWIIVAAAKVGGIHANSAYPADFIYENLAIQLNAIGGAFKAGVEKLIFLGSSCIYPKFADQPIKEEALLTGALESTNEPYAIAKIAGIKLCESYNRQYGTDYRALMPTNLYGPGDNYHPLNSHVIPGLIKRFCEAKSNNDAKVDVWGTGRARREFLFVDDLAEAIVHVMKLPRHTISSITSERCSQLNVGTGRDITIAELAYLVRNVIGFGGEIVFDQSKLDGTPRKLLDVSKLSSLGWNASTSLDSGVEMTYKHFKQVSGC